jgi:hypothetical protein
VIDGYCAAVAAAAGPRALEILRRAYMRAGNADRPVITAWVADHRAQLDAEEGRQ